MEDITSYGEISTAHHKGEMTVTAFVGGLCLALAGLFFAASGIYHIVVSLSPYWERVTVGPLAETKGSANFICFAIVSFARLFFGCLLGYIAMQMWDGRVGARRMLFVNVLPILVFIYLFVDKLDPDFAAEFLSFGGITSSLENALFSISLILVVMSMVLSVLLGKRLRDSQTDTSLVMAIIYLVCIFGGFGMVGSQLDQDEWNTAFVGNLAPFTAPGSGYSLIILDSVSEEYVKCMENLIALEKACEEHDKIQETRYENFDSVTRSVRLIEILANSGALSSEVSCPGGGKYVVDKDGNWTCTAHGVLDMERMKRGKRMLALMRGESVDEAAGDENSDDYNEGGDF